MTQYCKTCPIVDENIHKTLGRIDLTCSENGYLPSFPAMKLAYPDEETDV